MTRTRNRTRKRAEVATTQAPADQAVGHSRSFPGAPGTESQTGRSQPVPTSGGVPIPPLLLEGDEPAESAPAGPVQKFTLGATPGPDLPPGHGLASLPETYGTGTVLLTARDPRCLYLWWDSSSAERVAYSARAVARHLVARVYAGATETGLVTEMEVHPASQHWFIPVNVPGATYQAELGYYALNGGWIKISASNAVTTPMDAPSADTTVTLASLPPTAAAEPVSCGHSAFHAEQTPSSEQAEQGPALAQRSTERRIETAPEDATDIPADRTAPPALSQGDPRSTLEPGGPVMPPAAPGAPSLAGQEKGQAPRSAPEGAGQVAASRWGAWAHAEERGQVGADHVSTPGLNQACEGVARPGLVLPVSEAWSWTEEALLTEACGPEVQTDDKGVRVVERRGQSHAGTSSFSLPPRRAVSGAEVPMGISSQPGGEAPAIAEGPGGGLRPEFWLNVNAELVIYGATEPDGRVSIGGRPVRLRPDGTFSCRFALPDGEYELAVIALSNSGDGRYAGLRFSRRSEYGGDVGVHPSADELEVPGAGQGG